MNRPQFFLRCLAWVCLVALAVVSVVALTETVASRIPEYVEGFLTMSARRIIDHAPVYTDPIAGAYDYGRVPSRWYVGYSLPYAALLAYVPGGYVGGRLVSTGIWLGLLAALAWTPQARPNPVSLRLGLPIDARSAHQLFTQIRAQVQTRHVALIVVAIVLGNFRLGILAQAARPDTLAVAVVAWAVRAACLRGRLAPHHAAAFALAACIKPSIFGAFGGMLLFELLLARYASFGARAAALLSVTLAACVVVGVFVGWLHWESAGRWTDHYAAALYFKFTFSRFVDLTVNLVPFVAGPLVLGFLALYQARRHEEARRLAVVLIVSLLVAAIGLGKLGSALNYMMEPVAICVLICARFPPRLPATALSGLILIQCAWNAPMTLRESSALVRYAPAQQTALTRAATRCLRSKNDFAMSNDIGVESVLNHRIHVHRLEFGALVAAGKFTMRAWRNDMAAATCIVVREDYRRVSEGAEHALYSPDPQLRQELADTFQLIESNAGVDVFVRRDEDTKLPRGR